MHVWSILSKFGYCSSKAPTKITHYNNQLDKTYYSYRIITYSFTSLNWLYDLFYVNKVKVVPANIADLLTPVALAYWLMDDGSKTNSGGLVLCTQGFTDAEVQLLCDALYTN